MAALARLIAGGGGLGRSPRAPGTAASLAATLVAAPLLASGPVALPLACALATVSGLAALRTLRPAGDPGSVVIDEIAGQWLALLPLAGDTATWRHDWPWLLAGFGLFRLFDIAKPGPVGWIDRRSGALAIMGDDLAAGALAAALLWLARGLLHL